MELRRVQVEALEKHTEAAHFHARGVVKFHVLIPRLEVSARLSLPSPSVFLCKMQCLCVCAPVKLHGL